MDIKVTKEWSKDLNDFYAREWADEDLKHYGRNVPWATWIPEHFTLEVRQDGKIIGGLSFTINQDVAVIDLLIVDKNKRREGVGKELIEKVEEIVKEKSVHKIYLQTGKEWESVKFYESLGFIKTADVPDHYLHVDYIELSKKI